MFSFLPILKNLDSLKKKNLDFLNSHSTGPYYQFIYRIRHQLVFGTLIITALVAYFSQFLEKNIQLPPQFTLALRLIQD